jgi:hypothetical protein
MKCRHCASELILQMVNLGFAPPSNAYLTELCLKKPEQSFPLRVLVCEQCWLAQTEDFTSADYLFDKDYAYFSSTSSSWLEHARRFAEDVINRLSLTHESLVIEIAANDGYLLKNFIEAGIPCLGIEPTASTASSAQALGIPMLQEFFGMNLARRLVSEGGKADLIVGNNVYAHVPDINDFTAGLKMLLKSNGTISLEFPHLLSLINQVQFDTIYHEHFSYLSLYTVCRIFKKVGLRVWNVEQLSTHGGSLRVYGCHDDDPRMEKPIVGSVIRAEAESGLRERWIYQQFQSRVEVIKYNFLCFLISQKRAGKKVVAYGAAAKGNTLLNFSGVRPDLLPFVADASSYKQNKYLPGSRIPIVSPEMLSEQKPDFVIILPWNIADEVRQQLHWVSRSGCRFVVAVPSLSIHN